MAVSRTYHGYFKGDARMFHGCFKVCQGYLKIASGVFKACLKEGF